ncbi:hypothetical protein GCM10027610_048570 [Dactylosporangium cerinum]
MHDLFPAGAAPAPGSVHERYVADRLAGVGDGETLPDTVRRHATAQPDGIAFVAGGDRLTWAQFDARSTAFARRLAGAGLPVAPASACCCPTAWRCTWCTSPQ